VIVSGLADAEAYRIESKLITVLHKFHAGQLWNTIDERCMDRSMLPENWDDPECPLYRLPRPLPPRIGPVATWPQRAADLRNRKTGGRQQS
jgi:hypothetical protein